MVRVTDELALSADAVTLYHASDPLLGHLPVLAFHGPSTTANFTHNSSRIQVHIYSPAGFQSFPRLTVAPSSAFYGVVAHLPREFQGDEVCRGLAFALYKYFCERPEPVKAFLRAQYPVTAAAVTRGRSGSVSGTGSGPGAAPVLFGEQHAADLAKAMACVEINTADHLRALRCALQPQHVSSIDLDIVLPPGAITAVHDGDAPADDPDLDPDLDDDLLLDPTLRQYDPAYRSLVKLFGEPVFLPTAKLRRAPSRPSSLNHRSKAFTRDQKVELRMQMGELVDTEARYVVKLNELVRHIADDFRQRAAGDGDAADLSPDDVVALFPPSVDRILHVNAAFLQDLRRVMDDSEDGAVHDLDVPYTFGSASSRSMLASASASNSASAPGSVRVKDPTGALAMAKTFLEWFPSFTDCYQDYIRASQHFPALLGRLLDDHGHGHGHDHTQTHTTFRERVIQTTGEQALRSILIEPVQRLPRYSLFIDQIVGCLPITHPALPLMLRARDIITNICSMDDPLDTNKQPHVVHRLRNLIESWPADLEPRGRLVLAADVVELAAPYDAADTHALSLPDRAGMLLLFSDCVVVVKKKMVAGGGVPGIGIGTTAAAAAAAAASTTRTARDLLREVDKPSPAGLLVSMTNAAGGPGASYDFVLSGWHPLADVRFTESADGRLVWMASTRDMRGAHAGEHVAAKAPTTRCFALQETLAAKAPRWAEDVVKARIEGRFAEAERDSSTWTLRAVHLPDSSRVSVLAGNGSPSTLGLHAAVFQEGAEALVEGRREPAPVRVVFDNHRGTKGAPVGHYGVEIVVEVRTDATRLSSASGGGGGGGGGGPDANAEQRLLMTTVGLAGKRYVDDVTHEDFLPTLARRIVQLLGAQYCDVSNPPLVPALVSYHTKTLRALHFGGSAGGGGIGIGGSSRAEKTRSFLASSPVKLLSSFLGSGSGNGSGSGSGTPTAADTTATMASGAGAGATTGRSESIYGSLRLKRTQSQPGSLRSHAADVASLSGSIRDRSGGGGVAGGSFSHSADADASQPENPLVRLEETFTGYVAALQARKGHFAARTLLGSGAGAGAGSADELAVNLLYNKMNENPFHDDWAFPSGPGAGVDPETALPADVVFAAFAKFTRIAWRDQMGAVMTLPLLDALQERAARTVPGDFADFVHYLFADMAPQNRRAFTALVKLLADLLDGCRDDGDRGALTLAFAELLVGGGGGGDDGRCAPHNYINLLDRLVQDCDRISAMGAGFGSSGFGGGGGGGGGFGASGSSASAHVLRSSAHERSNKPATGSVASRTSFASHVSHVSHASHASYASHASNTSLRRRFGLESLLRQNSSSSRGLEGMAAGGGGGGGDSGSGNYAATPTADADTGERSSVWRSLSKHGHRHPATGESASLSKATASPYVSRSRSIDMGGGKTAANMLGRRPASRDRPPIAGAFDDGASATSQSRPTSSHQQLATIGEPDGEGHGRGHGYGHGHDNHTGNGNGSSSGSAGASGKTTGTADRAVRKKRRSSLSDLKSLMAATSLEDPVDSLRDVARPVDGGGTAGTTGSTTSGRGRSTSKAKDKNDPLPPVPLRTTKTTSEKVNATVVSPANTAAASTTATRTHSPSKIPVSPQSQAQAQVSASASFRGARQKENAGFGGLAAGDSFIPTLKASRAAGTTLLPPTSPTKGATSTTSGTGQRLRLQSPQKLRERLQAEKRAVEEVDAVLQSALSRITDDMARLGAAPAGTEEGGDGGDNGDNGDRGDGRAAATDLRQLAARVRALEAALPQQVQAVAARQAALQADMEATVAASEGKVRAIDQLYREATAENELLYERFNGELGKMVRALKGKGREDKEELVAKLKEQADEMARLRKENARLRREAVSLRTLLKGGTGG